LIDRYHLILDIILSGFTPRQKINSLEKAYIDKGIFFATLHTLISSGSSPEKHIIIFVCDNLLDSFFEFYNEPYKNRDLRDFYQPYR